MGAIAIFGVGLVIVGIFVAIVMAFLGMSQGVILEIIPGVSTVISGIIV